MARPPAADAPPGAPLSSPTPTPTPTAGPVSVGAVVRAVLTAPFTGRTWKELAYLLLASFLSAASCVPAAVLMSPGVLVLIALIVAGTEAVISWWLVGVLLGMVVVGMAPLMALVVMGARHVSGPVHRGLAAALLKEHVPEPAPPARQTRPGFVAWLRVTLSDGPGWRALIFLVLSNPLTAIGSYIALLMLPVGLVMVGYPLWWSLTDPVNVGPDGVEHHSGMQFGDYYIETWPRALVVAGVGLTLLFVLPWVVRGFTWVDRWLVRGLLGPGPTEARLRDLEETRSQVVDDSAATLRRIERDLHDGTQARLVALAMQLDMAREQLAGDDEAAGAEEPVGDQAAREQARQRARQLVETAHRNATEAITELREVTRSIHPPILDRGLDAALATLAAGSAVPTLLHTDIRERPSAAIETIAYFCVAELLANVAKHSRARQATVVVATRQDHDHRRLRIEVRDDGVGGAHVGRSAGAGGSAGTGPSGSPDPSGSSGPGGSAGPGGSGRLGRSGSDRAGGLAGLADRLRGVDGRLAIDSPAGGPTLVTVDLPTTA